MSGLKTWEEVPATAFAKHGDGILRREPLQVARTLEASTLITASLTSACTSPSADSGRTLQATSGLSDRPISPDEQWNR